MPTTSCGFFGERQRHAAAAAAGVENAPGQRHAGAIEEGDHLRAAVVLEQRVVVLGPEAEVGVRLDGAFVNLAHDRSSVRRPRANLSMSAARSWPVAVSATSKVMMMVRFGIGVEHVLDDRVVRWDS